MQLLLLLIIIALVFAAAIPAATASNNEKSSWKCTTLSQKRVPDASSPIEWKKLSCIGSTPYPLATKVGPLTINIVEANLAHPRAFAVSAKAQTPIGLAPLSEIMQKDRDAASLYAGVNGGYFYRLDVHSFFDDVCIGKNAADARRAVNVSQPIDGVGDCLSVRDGVVESTNCGCLGYNRPAVFVMNGTETDIVVQDPHTSSHVPAGAVNAIAAGPNLVSSSPSNGSFVDIPTDDENLNRFERAAATAVGFRRADSVLSMVTIDGSDKCSLFNATCGLNVFPLAAFMKDYVNASVAMSMDQGGSTTMVVRGSGAKNGVVSCSDVMSGNCGDGSQRNIFNGLFVGLR